MGDIWETFEEDDEEISKRQLIGSVVKASDGSYQLFKDHRNHIGTNQMERENYWNCHTIYQKINIFKLA